MTNLRELDLSENENLKSLPRSMNRLYNLETLNISETGIGKVPRCVREYKKLKKLSFDGVIPNWIGELSNLEYISMGWVKKISESIGELKNLRDLDIRCYKIKTLPNSICKLSSLKELIINGDLKELPETFGNLKSLRELRLSSNSMETLPDSFRNLRSLEILQIGKGMFSHGDEKPVPLALPRSIGRLSSLKELTINVPIRPIPDWLGGLSSLKTLYLTTDTITSLPDSLCRLPSLKEFFIDCPRLATLPENFGSLRSLTTLNIKGIYLATFPDSLGNLENLETLDINVRSLLALPESIGNLSSLEKLHIYRTEIKTLPDSIGNLARLETLYIQGSKLTALPESIGSLGTLRVLRLQYTDITSLPESIGDLANLEFLGVYNYSNPSFWDFIEYQPNKLDKDEKVIERKCPLAALPDTVSKLKSLKYLILNNTEVSSLPACLGDLPALELLEIVECNVKTIPPSIRYLADSGELSLFRTKKEHLRHDWDWHPSQRRKHRRK